MFISVGLLVSVLGNYLSWSLLAAEVLLLGGENDTMPSALATENRNQAPAAALWLTNVVMQVFLILTSFAEHTFTLALKMTSSMTLVPYCWSPRTACSWRGRARRMRPYGVAAATWRGRPSRGLYAAAMIYAGGPKFLLLSALIYAPGTICSCSPAASRSGSCSRSRSARCS